jgi:predicted pyridoxine 5'-phosphate oxidase superfamily flavin-nucleotide-binding protein
MTTPPRPSSDVAFTGRVKAEQARHGSRAAYARLEREGGFETEINDDLAAFVARQRSAFLATASAGGQPYVQHRGGPAGFLKTLDPHTIAFADFAGNRQFISLGNLAENPKVHLFLIDYEHRQRIKIWGEARVVEDDAPLLKRLTPVGYRAKPERAIVIRVTAWDANCPQHIPQRLEAADVEAALAKRDARIADLEAQVKALRLNRRASGAAPGDGLDPLPKTV